MARIVLISDKRERSRELVEHLEGRGHAVTPMDYKELRFQVVLETQPDLLIVDFESMSREAVDSCQRVLSRLSIEGAMLGIFGALDSERDLSTLVTVADALSQTKSFRSTPGTGDFGFMSLDVHRREVVVRGQSIALTPTETHILSILAVHAGSYVSAASIVAEMYGFEVTDHEAGDIVRVHIHNLRRKFQRTGGPPYIVCSRGKGYLLERRTRAALGA